MTTVKRVALLAIEWVVVGVGWVAYQIAPKATTRFVEEILELFEFVLESLQEIEDLTDGN